VTNVGRLSRYATKHKHGKRDAWPVFEREHTEGKRQGRSPMSQGTRRDKTCCRQLNCKTVPIRRGYASMMNREKKAHGATCRPGTKPDKVLRKQGFRHMFKYG